MVGGGGAMMMCLFLVMVKTEEDMVFLQRVSTTGSDYKLVENLRRKLLTNNNDYELQEGRNRTLETAWDNVDANVRTQKDKLQNTIDRTSNATLQKLQYRAQESPSDKVRTRASEATSDKIGTREPKSKSHNLSLGIRNSTLDEVANVKNALNRAMRLAERQVTKLAPHPAPPRSYHIYRYPHRRMNGNVGVTFTVKRFKFRPI